MLKPEPARTEMGMKSDKARTGYVHQRSRRVEEKGLDLATGER